MSSVSNPRASVSNSHISTEEAALIATKEIMAIRSKAVTEQEFLTILAKCMLALRDPKIFLDNKNYHSK